MYGYCPLSSGSKGNAIFVGSKKTKILIDAGISMKSLEEKLGKLGISLSEIDAILVTHEHTDHIAGLPVIAGRFGIPIFANSETAKAIAPALKGRKASFKIFTTGETFQLGDMEIHPFSIQHDAIDPVAFTFHFGKLKLGICTDLGFATTLVKERLKACDFLMVESNHEPSMVHSSSRPLIYKQRVLSRQGHLSNSECATLTQEIAHSSLKHIHLAHLSSECNSPELALKTTNEKLSLLGLSIPIDIAPQDSIGTPIPF